MPGTMADLLADLRHEHSGVQGEALEGAKRGAIGRKIVPVAYLTLGRSGPPKSTNRHSLDFDGWQYTEDEIQFMNAMQKFKVENHRPNPTCREVLQVLKFLGYEKRTA